MTRNYIRVNINDANMCAYLPQALRAREAGILGAPRGPISSVLDVLVTISKKNSPSRRGGEFDRRWCSGGKNSLDLQKRRQQCNREESSNQTANRVRMSGCFAGPKSVGMDGESIERECLVRSSSTPTRKQCAWQPVHCRLSSILVPFMTEDAKPPSSKSANISNRRNCDLETPSGASPL
jgi:hypothetical protein